MSIHALEATAFCYTYNEEMIMQLLAKRVGEALDFHTLILPDKDAPFVHSAEATAPETRFMLDQLYDNFKATEGIVKKTPNNGVVSIREIGDNARAVRIEEFTVYDPPSYKVIVSAVK